MQLNEILSLDCTLCAVQNSSKKKLLETISDMVAPKLVGVSNADVFNSLLQRERLGSTGIGQGIAIPHGRLAQAQRPMAALITLAQPIDFGAIDNQPIDIIFALLVPEADPAQHLQTLAEVARRLNDQDFCRTLRKARTDEELYSTFIKAG